MPIKTMRDLSTRGNDRARSLQELARLEQERTRIEQALDVWLANQRKAERQLSHVQSRIAEVQAALGLAEGVPTPQPQPQRPVRRRDDSDGCEPFVLEY